MEIQFLEELEEVEENSITKYEAIIIKSARMSTTGDLKGFERDVKFINYLWRNKHMSPFEMVDLTVQVEAPIFVARQWMRHRTQNFNEHSARYSELEDKFYIPTELKKQGNINLQGSGEVLDPLDQIAGFEMLDKIYNECYNTYKALLDLGVSREQARIVMPVGTYTKFIAKANLRNWIHFIELRSDEHAQEEIRWFSDQIKEYIFTNMLPNLKI